MAVRCCRPSLDRPSLGGHGDPSSRAEGGGAKATYTIHMDTASTSVALSLFPSLNMPEWSLSAPHLGGKSVIILFVLTLIAFVVESQLTQVCFLRSIDFPVSPS